MTMLGLLFSQIEELTDNEQIKLLVSKGKDVIGQIEDKKDNSKNNFHSEKVVNQTSNANLDNSENLLKSEKSKSMFFILKEIHSF